MRERDKTKKMIIKLNDPLIRESLSREIFNIIPNFNKIIEELELGKGESRIDLAVLGKEFIGIEIKSDCDSLARLESQILTYNRSLEKIILIVGEKHALSAKEHIPQWWGYGVATLTNEREVEIKIHRKPKKNPEFFAPALLSLLWKNEAIDLLETKGITKGVKSLAKWNLVEIITQTFSSKEIRDAVLNTLATRSSWKSAL